MLQRERNKLLKIQCPAKHSFFYMNSVQPVTQLSSLLQEQRFKPLNDTKPTKLFFVLEMGFDLLLNWKTCYNGIEINSLSYNVQQSTLFLHEFSTTCYSVIYHITRTQI